MWESLRPGMTVRPPASIIRVPLSLQAITSLSFPTARKSPSAMATALANGRSSVRVAMLPLCMISSAFLAAEDRAFMTWPPSDGYGIFLFLSVSAQEILDEPLLDSIGRVGLQDLH